MVALSQDAVTAIRALCTERFGEGNGGIRPVAIAPPPDQQPAHPPAMRRHRDHHAQPGSDDQDAGGRGEHRGAGRLAAMPVACPAPGDIVTGRDGAACYLDPAMAAALEHRTLLGPVGAPDQHGTITFVLTEP